jgi:hypothetical protein
MKGTFFVTVFLCGGLFEDSFNIFGGGSSLEFVLFFPKRRG